MHQLRRFRIPALVGLCLAAALAAGPGAGCSALAQPNFPSGSSSRADREEALAALPMVHLSADAQRRIAGVVDRATLYRRMPATTIETDPDLFVLLARYPEIVVEIWQLMGVSQMTCERTGPFTLKSDDGSGTKSEVELVYGTPNTHLYYGTGLYTGNLLRRPVPAECVIMLRTRYGQGSEQQTLASNTLDVFLFVDNALLGAAARTVMPLVARTADHNFVESIRFVQRLNETTEKNGPGVQGMAWRLDGLRPDVRQQFIETAGMVHERALARKSALVRAAGQVTERPEYPFASVQGAVWQAEPGPRTISISDQGR